MIYKKTAKSRAFRGPVLYKKRAKSRTFRALFLCSYGEPYGEICREYAENIQRRMWQMRLKSTAKPAPNE